MKYKIIIFTFCLIITKCGIAQEAPLLNEYLIDNQIDKFVGIWQWTSGQDTVTIRLKKLKYYLTNTEKPFYSDNLIGTHRYVKNGVVVEDNMNQFINLGQNYKGTLFGWSNKRVSDTLTVYCTFEDVTKHKLELIDMKYIPGVVPQMSWLLYNRTGIDRPGKLPGLTLPSVLTLTKQ
jgi:hypothetical protein